MSFFKRLFRGDRRKKDEEDEPGVTTGEIEPVPITTVGQTRPLPPLEEFHAPTSRLRYGHSTDVGLVRANNQDALFTFLGVVESENSPPPFGLFIVADGMGGHTDGERASVVAAQTLARHVTNLIYLPMLTGLQPGSEQKTIPEVLEEGMEEANLAVNKEVTEGGTTVTAAVIYGDLVYVAHVGDSRAYLVNDNNLELITRDHSLVRRLQELGQLTAEEAEIHPQRNVLYRAIGQGDALDVDRATRRLPPGSQLLLCSDGLWGVIDEATIMKIIDESPNVQEACDRLIAAANQNGGPDNITAVLVQMPI